MINGLILAGGRSSRMGRDKSLIAYHEKPQREHLFELLQPHCNTVYLSCKVEEKIPEILNPLPDQYEMSSPLNGILTAFNKEGQSAWLVVAVDMPFINDETIFHLIQHRKSSKPATCFYDSDGLLPEPLFSIWEPEAGILLRQFLKDGQVSPRKFLLHHGAHLIRLRDTRILTNINSEEELKRYF